ncbi:hypothetical protein [Halarchaeum sp. P4]|uniref:hypothetical protein n=1 Tax=Halarchaeum sp. P4 TaxID=3421639 RepID=UPI003EB72AB5
MEEAQPTTTSNSTNTLVRGNITYHNASAEKLAAVNGTMVQFFEKLPENKSERMATVATAAEESCNIGRISESPVKMASATHKQGQQLYQVARLVNEKFNSQIQPNRIRSVAQSARKVGQYATIIGTYNNYVNASCAFDRDKPETVEDYYLATASLGFELLLFQYGMYYKTASKITRVASHTHTYRAIQATFGDKALGTVMSGTYWLTHGTLGASPDFVRDRLDQMGISASSNVSRANYSVHVGQFVGTEVVPRNISKGATRCVGQVMNEMEDSSGLWGSVTDKISGVANIQGTLRGGFSTSEVLETVKGVDAKNLTDKQIQKVQKCMRG